MATTNEKGTFENPFTITEFETMSTGGTWTGGWVTLSIGDVVYKTSDGTTEQAIGTNALGSQPNPFSLTAFQELSAKGFWQGGYVREANGNVHYYREDSECSICGSGSEFGSDATPSGGSGSGSGSGERQHLLAGTQDIRPDCIYPQDVLRVTWGSGYFDGGTLPSLDVELICSTDDHKPLISTKIPSEWENSYRVKMNIQGQSLFYFYDIPNEYRQ